MLSQLKKLASGILLVGAAISRFYAYCYGHENQAQSSTRNMMLSNTFSAYQMVSQYPQESNLSLVALPAMTMLTTAYSLYRDRDNRLDFNGPANPVWANGPIMGRQQPSVAQMPVPSAPLLDNTFESRLEALGFDSEQIPERFLDPISMCVMDNPVRAKTTIRNSRNEPIDTYHYYDKETFDSLNGICPSNRQPFLEVCDDNALKAEIASFVSEKENSIQDPASRQILAA